MIMCAATPAGPVKITCPVELQLARPWGVKEKSVNRVFVIPFTSLVCTIASRAAAHAISEEDPAIDRVAHSEDAGNVSNVMVGPNPPTEMAPIAPCHAAITEMRKRAVAFMV